MKDALTPRQIVEELDRYIIGQDKAKRAVAIALRNRYRRAQVDPAMQEEITPKNIIMGRPDGRREDVIGALRGQESACSSRSKRRSSPRSVTSAGTSSR